jgi:hypothetical protein
VTPVSTDSDDEDEDTTQNEDSNGSDSNDVADAAPTEAKATGLVHIFGHHSKATGKTTKATSKNKATKKAKT